MASAKTATLAGFGLAGVALGTALTLTLTTLTATTGNITTVNSTTVSANTVTNSSGSFVLNNSGLETSKTLSGSLVEVNAQAAGSGTVKINGSDGGGVCAQDSDGAGWTRCSYLNGTQTCATVASC